MKRQAKPGRYEEIARAVYEDSRGDPDRFLAALEHAMAEGHFGTMRLDEALDAIKGTVRVLRRRRKARERQERLRGVS